MQITVRNGAASHLLKSKKRTFDGQAEKHGHRDKSRSGADTARSAAFWIYVRQP